MHHGVSDGMYYLGVLVAFCTMCPGVSGELVHQAPGTMVYLVTRWWSRHHGTPWHTQCPALRLTHYLGCKYTIPARAPPTYPYIFIHILMRFIKMFILRLSMLPLNPSINTC